MINVGSITLFSGIHSSRWKICTMGRTNIIYNGKKGMFKSCWCVDDVDLWRFGHLHSVQDSSSLKIYETEEVYLYSSTALMFFPLMLGVCNTRLHCQMNICLKPLNSYKFPCLDKRNSSILVLILTKVYAVLGKSGQYFSMVVIILIFDAWSHSQNIGEEKYQYTYT